LWVLDAAINDRGMYLDGDLLDSAINIAGAAQRAITAELKTIAEGAVTSINQPAKLIAWLSAHGCKVANIQKTTLQKALTRANLPQAARRVIELRLEGAHAAAAKLATMRAWRNPDGRARGAFRFHGASTGRWTSFGIQLQNMKRPSVEDMDAAIAAVATGDLKRLRERFLQPMAVVGDVARAIIRAAPGARLIAADFSGIESRVTAWLSGEQSKLDRWAKFDQSGDPHDEPYFRLGQTFGLSGDLARKIGKTADLAFGYAGGPGAWKRLAGDDDKSSEADIRGFQHAWKRAHPETVRLWRALDHAAVRAVQKPGEIFKCKRLAFSYDGTFLRMHLPNGREIAYPFPRLRTNNRGNCVVIFKDNDKGKWVDCRQGQGAYGGTWIENAVQAVARDLFAEAMSRLEAVGYPITLHVHDEIVAEVPEGFGSKEEFLRIMLALPGWAEGLPVAAKIREGERFCKITSPKASSDVEEANSTDDVDQVNGATADLGVVGDTPPRKPTPEVIAASINSEDDVDQCARDGADRHGNGYASGEREWGRNVGEYIYRDENGAPYLRAVRTSAKQFPQYHWENGRWVKGKPAGPKIPYRLPELRAAAPATAVFICEGEKDADNVAALGLIATTNSEGAGKWTAELNKWFTDKQTVFILEDNDDAGRSHAAKVASALHGIVPEIRVVSFSELPPHGDVSDWLEMGGTKAQLLERTKTAKAPHPPGKGYTLVRASDIVPRPMDWLWEGHILRGSLELLTDTSPQGVKKKSRRSGAKFSRMRARELSVVDYQHVPYALTVRPTITTSGVARLGHCANTTASGS
jgi:DNA polymerase